MVEHSPKILTSEEKASTSTTIVDCVKCNFRPLDRNCLGDVSKGEEETPSSSSAAVLLDVSPVNLSVS